MNKVKIHSTAEVHPSAKLGGGTSVWNQSQIREGARVGGGCIIGKNVYIDFEVKVGDHVKIQNNVSVYHGVTVGDGVFIGPHVVFTNDLVPRAINPDGSLKSDKDWKLGKTTIKAGASIGAGSVILPNITIGKFALIGAGSVVTKNVPDHALVFGNPARIVGMVCKCGKKILSEEKCSVCKFKYPNDKQKK